MAELKDTIINGNLEVDGIINLPTNKGVRAIHPMTGDSSSLVYMSTDGNTMVGWGGYTNKNGNTNIYGNDVFLYAGNANASFRPYYRAGDSIDVVIRTAGYCSNSATVIRFVIPIDRPVIGIQSINAVSEKGLTPLQNGKRTHGATSDAFATVTKYTATLQNGCIAIEATMAETTDAVNFAPIGVYWTGTIIFS